MFESNGAARPDECSGTKFHLRVSESGGVQPGHSVLILRIGSLVVAEWSHYGQCSIWMKARVKFRLNFSARHMPSAFEEGISGRASGDNLARQGIFWHSGSETYSWQTRIAAFLKAAATSSFDNPTTKCTHELSFFPYRFRRWRPYSAH